MGGHSKARFAPFMEREKRPFQISAKPNFHPSLFLCFQFCVLIAVSRHRRRSALNTVTFGSGFIRRLFHLFI
jgi:hypothetical protein